MSDERGEHDDRVQSPEEPDEQPDEQPDGSEENVAVFLQGAVFGAVMLGIVWVFVAVMTDGSDDAVPAADLSRADRSTAALASHQPRPRPTTLDRCDGAAAAIEVPIEAAEPAMDQWELHIGAMNKLVVGAITLQQANAFWNQTRVGAHRRIDAFNAADAQASEHPTGCPAPEKIRANEGPAARMCARRVDVDRAALRISRTAVGTWQIHVHHMEMLRRGMMSPARAVKLWMSMWQRGVEQLKDYRAAARRADSVGACPGVASAAGRTADAPPSPGETSSTGMDMP